METISARELDWYAASGRFIIIDLRSEKEYRKAHVPGAINIPNGEFGSNYGFAKERPLILYCERGAFSMTVARRLELQGYHVKSVVGGFMAYQRRKMW